MNSTMKHITLDLESMKKLEIMDIHNFSAYVRQKISEDYERTQKPDSNLDAAIIQTENEKEIQAKKKKAHDAFIDWVETDEEYNRLLDEYHDHPGSKLQTLTKGLTAEEEATKKESRLLWMKFDEYRRENEKRIKNEVMENEEA